MTQRCPAPNPTCGGLFLDRVGGCSERGGRGTRETARGRDKPERDLLLPNLFSRPKPSSQPDTARCDHRRRLAPSSPPTIIIPSLGPCLLASAHVSLLLACFLLLFFLSWPLCCLKSPFYHLSRHIYLCCDANKRTKRHYDSRRASENTLARKSTRLWTPALDGRRHQPADLTRACAHLRLSIFSSAASSRRRGGGQLSSHPSYSMFVSMPTRPA